MHCTACTALHEPALHGRTSAHQPGVDPQHLPDPLHVSHQVPRGVVLHAGMGGAAAGPTLRQGEEREREREREYGEVR